MHPRIGVAVQELHASDLSEIYNPLRYIIGVI